MEEYLAWRNRQSLMFRVDWKRIRAQKGDWRRVMWWAQNGELRHCKARCGADFNMNLISQFKIVVLCPNRSFSGRLHIDVRIRFKAKAKCLLGRPGMRHNAWRQRSTSDEAPSCAHDRVVGTWIAPLDWAKLDRRNMGGG